MLNLRNDIYSRLVTSAHKNRSLNQQFKKSIYSSNWTENTNSDISGRTKGSLNSSANIANFNSSNISSSNIVESDFDKRLSQAVGSTNISGDALSINGNTSFIKSKIVPSKKIDEQIELTASESTLDEIKLDLDVAEQLLTRIKSSDPYNQKIPVIERTISRLKAIIVKKMAN
jgi:hypothetical protein